MNLGPGHSYHFDQGWFLSLFCIYFLLSACQSNGAEESLYPKIFEAKEGDLDLDFNSSSIKILKSGSVAIYEIGPLSGKLTVLKGKVYFDLSHGDSLQWNMGVDSLLVEAAHAQFSIAIRDDLIEIAVRQGRVVVYHPPRKVEVFSGQRLIFKDNNLAITRLPSRNWFSWVDGILVFENANLREFVRDLSNHFEIDVKWEDNLSLLKCKFNYRFESIDIQYIMDSMFKEYGVESVLEDNGGITIVKTGCS
ncbi:MAG TPA: hypothetical protein PKC30_13690 [Saprospiraceae bacterium]|nr:hypothetical protein [Saprospiraceae bacterium]